MAALSASSRCLIASLPNTVFFFTSFFRGGRTGWTVSFVRQAVNTWQSKMKTELEAQTSGQSSLYVNRERCAATGASKHLWVRAKEPHNSCECHHSYHSCEQILCNYKLTNGLDRMVCHKVHGAGFIAVVLFGSFPHSPVRWNSKLNRRQKKSKRKHR